MLLQNKNNKNLNDIARVRLIQSQSTVTEINRYKKYVYFYIYIYIIKKSIDCPKQSARSFTRFRSSDSHNKLQRTDIPSVQIHNNKL